MTEAHLIGLQLDDVKAHLRVLHDDDDLAIQRLIDASVEELARYIGAPLTAATLPADLGLAVCEMVAHAYDHRADPEAKVGLVPAAARIAARHRRVVL